MKKFLLVTVFFLAIVVVGCAGAIQPMSNTMPTEERENYLYFNLRNGEQPQYVAEIPQSALDGAGLVIGAFSFAAEPVYLNFNGEGMRYYSFRTAYGEEIFAVALPAGRYVLQAYEQRDPSETTVVKQQKFDFMPKRKFTVLPNTVVNLGYIYDASQLQGVDQSTVVRNIIELRKKDDTSVLLRRDMVMDDPNESELINEGKSKGAIYKLIIPGLSEMKYYIAEWEEWTPPETTGEAPVAAGAADQTMGDDMMGDDMMGEQPLDTKPEEALPPAEGMGDVLGDEGAIDEGFELEDEGGAGAGMEEDFGDFGGGDLGGDDSGGESLDEDFGDFGGEDFGGEDLGGDEGGDEFGGTDEFDFGDDFE